MSKKDKQPKANDLETKSVRDILGMLRPPQVWSSALLVSGGADKTLRLWDVAGGRQLKQIEAGDSSVYTAAFNPDSVRVAAAGLDKKIRIFNVLTGVVQTTIEGHLDYVYRVTS